MFLHSRSEAEFSGIYTMFVMDKFTQIDQVGIRLGFNENDDLEYYMFRGKGKNVGRIASLAPFDEHGRAGMVVQAAGDPQTPPGRGQRMVYRPVRDFPHMTDEQVHEAALQRTTAFGGGVNAPQIMAGNAMPFTDKLAGKEFTVRCDRSFDREGLTRHYRIHDGLKLSYRTEGDARWQEADYRAFEPDENLIFFGHLLNDSKPRANEQVVIDLSNGLVTNIHSHMGTPYFGNETTYYPLFGVVEMEGIKPPRYLRHKLTDELTGQAFSWSYSDTTTAMHLYASPKTMSWTIYTENQTLGAQWCAPCIFVKLRPGVYLFCTCEEACNGAQMCEVINTKIVRANGFGFSGGARGVSLGLVGALGRYIGRLDTAHLFGPKARM
jgi:hypothetical protein